MKLSISLDDESTQLLLAMKKEQSGATTSSIVQEAIKAWADKLGYVLVPAHVEHVKRTVKEFRTETER